MLIMFLCCGNVMAQNQKEGKECLPIQLTFNYSKPGSGNVHHPKMPQLLVTVYLDGHVLNVGERFVGFTLELVQDECVCYQHSILLGEETIYLPESLTGDFTIRFFDVDGNVYVGLLSFDYLD